MRREVTYRLTTAVVTPVVHDDQRDGRWTEIVIKPTLASADSVKINATELTALVAALESDGYLDG